MYGELLEVPVAIRFYTKSVLRAIWMIVLVSLTLCELRHAGLSSNWSLCSLLNMTPIEIVMTRTLPSQKLTKCY